VENSFSNNTLHRGVSKERL